MHSTTSKQFLLLAPFIFLALSLWAEQPVRPGAGDPSAPVGIGPRPVIQSSGYAFAGTVKAVQHVAAAKANGIATTRITFHVDRAIRGTRTGQTLVISEWAGLWAAGEQYRAGQQVLLFLYPPSKLGLTSPVRGPAGRFRIGGKGRIVVSPGQRSGLPAAIRARLGENGEIEEGEFAQAMRVPDGSQP
jgi:hypothetical protein